MMVVVVTVGRYRSAWTTPPRSDFVVSVSKSCATTGSSKFILVSLVSKGAQEQARVGSAEAAVEVHGHLHGRGARGSANVIELATLRGRVEVQRQGQRLLAQGQGGDDRLERARGAQQVSGDRLRGAHRREAAFEHSLDGQGL